MKYLLSLVAFAVVVAVLGSVKYTQIQAAIAMGASMAPPPPAVSTVSASVEPWPDVLESIGTLRAEKSVVLASEAEGTVREIRFASGARVKAGDVLVRLDQAVEEAELGAALAREELARAELARARELRERGVNSSADLDLAVAEARRTAAEVAALRERLVRRTVRAPFDGRVGIRSVDLGQYVRAGEPVVALEASDPIVVDFNVPQRRLADVRVGQPVEVRTDAYAGAVFRGEVTAVEPRVDTGTRNVRVRATLPNADERLVSGVFGRVRVVLGSPRGRVSIPTASIAYNPYGDFVYVVVEQAAPDGTPGFAVQQRRVTLGGTRGDLAAIDTGLAAGERIVANGTSALRDGQPVRIEEGVRPSADPEPTPSNS